MSLFRGTVPHPLLAERLRTLIEREGAGGVVLGFPRHEDGSPARIAPVIEELGLWIGASFRVPVALWDEFGTSLEAEERLREAPRRRRRDKGTVDRLAAQSLLQSFLDAGCPLPEARPGGAEG